MTHPRIADHLFRRSVRKKGRCLADFKEPTAKLDTLFELQLGWEPVVDFDDRVNELTSQVDPKTARRDTLEEKIREVAQKEAMRSRMATITAELVRLASEVRSLRPLANNIEEIVEYHGIKDLIPQLIEITNQIFDKPAVFLSPGTPSLGEDDPYLVCTAQVGKDADPQEIVARQLKWNRAAIDLLGETTRSVRLIVEFA